MRDTRGSIPSTLREVLNRRSIDLTQHRAVGLEPGVLEFADLVLGFEHGHAAGAVVDAGARHEVTFLLRELDRLLTGIEPGDEADPMARARSQIQRAHELRTANPRHVPGEEIEDPIGGPDSAYEAMIDEVSAVCGRIAYSLFGTRQSS